jgi:uroporphyrinogen-III synthase
MIKQIHFLNTRPEPLNRHLSDLLQQEVPYCRITEFPALEIVPLDQQKLENQAKMLLENQAIDSLIFTSASAVKYGHAFFKCLQEDVQVFAIGTQTQKMLCDYGWSNIIIPSTMSSEGLISEITCGHRQFFHAVLIKGLEGRTLLKQTLGQVYGITMTEFDCYMRMMPVYTDAYISGIFSNIIDIILITSVHAYQNLKEILRLADISLTPASQWLVFSDRIKAVIQQDWPDSRISVCEPQISAVIQLVKLLSKDIIYE